MKLIVCSILLCVVTGCSSWFPTKTIYRTKTITNEPFHPAKPTPLYVNLPHVKLLTPKTKDEIINDDQQYVYIIYTWEEYLELAKSIEQFMTKFNEYNVLLCHYRRALNEPECKNKIPPLPAQPAPVVSDEVVSESVN